MLQPNSLGLLGYFLAGVILSFSPCVYPLVPVTAGVICVKAGNSKIRGFLLSLIYVLGIAITYSVLGLIAALTGRVFGSIARSPLSNFIVGIIFILFSLSLLDIFSLPAKTLKLPDRFKNKGICSVFFLGLASGLVISPCLVPVLGSLLAYIARRQNILYGVISLFVFAYGLGFLLILVGTFSGLLMNLPKTGRWMAWIKKASGFLLMAVGIYFLIQAIGAIR